MAREAVEVSVQPEAFALPAGPADRGRRGRALPRATSRLIAACISARELRLQRHQRLLRLALRMAAAGRPEELYAALLAEAVLAIGGSGGTLYRWCERRQSLAPVLTNGQAVAVQPVTLGEGPVGKAAAMRRAAAVPHAPRVAAGEPAPDAALAVPLEHAGCLRGVLLIGRPATAGPLTTDDCRVVEQIAEVAAAAVAGLERARLEGAALAVRTLQHELNNQLTLTAGYAELVAADPELPGHLQPMASCALRGAIDASGTLHRLGRLRDLREIRWGSTLESTLDVAACEG